MMEDLLCIGDSLTYGFDVAAPYRWVNRVQRALGIRIQNEGVCGSTTDMMAYSMRQLDLARYDSIFLMGGSNDILQDIPMEQIQRHMIAMVQRAVERKVPVYIGIPLRMKPESALFGWQRAEDVYRHNQIIDEYRQWLLQLCRDYGCRAVDFYDAVFSAERDEKQQLYADGVHPNEAGYALLADTFMACL